MPIVLKILSQLGKNISSYRSKLGLVSPITLTIGFKKVNLLNPYNYLFSKTRLNQSS